SLGVAVATSPVINSMFDSLGEAIGEAMGENQTIRVQKLISVVNEMAIAAVSGAQMIVAGADLINRAYAAVQVVFWATSTAVLAFSENANRGVLAVVEAANQLPGV